MINRSSLKYTLKKILPHFLFSVILFVWQKSILHCVTYIDRLRLRKFTEEKTVELTHRSQKFLLSISPSNGFIDKHIFLYGVYEPYMLDIIREYLRVGETFVDIGANIGQHSMYAASIVGASGSVYSYEPIPRIYTQLVKSSHLNHFEAIIHPSNIALGAVESIETLTISQENIGGSSLVLEENGAEKIEVQIKKGDDELLALSSIQMIKIDVEGYEYEVLEGSRASLLKHAPILLLEFSGEIYQKQRKGHGAMILTLLTELGYTLYDIEDNKKQVTDNNLFLRSIENIRKQTNLLCIMK